MTDERKSRPVPFFRFPALAGGCVGAWLALGLCAVDRAAAQDAAAVTLKIDKVAVVTDVEGGGTRKAPKYGFVLIELRGVLQVAGAPKEFEAVSFSLQPMPSEVDVGYVLDFGFVGIGVVDDKGKAVYPFLRRVGQDVSPGAFSAKLPGGGIEVKSVTGSVADSVKVLGESTPVCLLFRHPVPKEGSLKLTVNGSLGQAGVTAAAPELKLSAADLGSPIPPAKKRDAEMTFKSGKPFYLWTETPMVYASQDYLRFAVNPALSLADLPKTDDITTVLTMDVQQKMGNRITRVPNYTVSGVGQFGYYSSRSSAQYVGMGRAALILLKRSAEMTHPPKGEPLSNKLMFQINFNPPPAPKGAVRARPAIPR